MKKILLLLLLCPMLLWAQVVKITPQDIERRHSFFLLRDGSVVRGRIVRQDSTLLTVRKTNGQLTFVEIDQLASISPGRPNAPVTTMPRGLPGQYSVFVLKDGSQIEGRFVRRDSTMTTVRKRNGQFSYFESYLLARVDSTQTEPVAAVSPTVSLSPRPVISNRFSPWLLTGQTAHTAETGRLYYRNTFLLVNEFAYGISRNWSIGAGINPFYAAFDYGSDNPRVSVLYPAVRFTTKISFPIGDQFRFGVSATYRPSQQSKFYRLDHVLTIQGLATFGDSQRNATLGYGQNRYGGRYPINYPFITAGIMHKLSPSLTFLSDNTFYISSAFQQTNLSAALRFDRRRHAFDLGLLGVVYPQYYPGSRALFSPYVGYNLIFGP